MQNGYVKLRNEVVRLAERLTERYANHLVCRAGCSACCRHHLSVFKVEADILREAIGRLPEDLRERIRRQSEDVDRLEALGEPVSCPLLVDDRCAVYESRPLICRTQGLPLLFENEEDEQEVDFCPLNFNTPGAIDDLNQDSLVPLDAINLKLALANLQYCIETGVDREKIGERMRMSEIIKVESRK